MSLESVGSQGCFSGNNSPSGAMVCFDNTPVVNEVIVVNAHHAEDTPIDLTASEGTTVNHCVKVISHNSRDGIQIHKWESRNSMFYDVDILKAGLSVDFQHYVLNDDFQFGFIAPGHGSRGRQVPLKSNSDLENMYDEHKNRREVVLWLKVVKGPRKRPLSNSALINIDSKTKKPNLEQGSGRGSNYQGHLKHFSYIQCIVDKLEKMHAGDYSPEQLRAWAHMIDMKKHSSYDTQPQKPFFKRAVSATKQLSISPGKRIKYRSECIDQLDRWHALLEKGVIDQKSYRAPFYMISNNFN